MLARLLDLPLIVILMGISALAMLAPAAYALTLSDHQTARAFFYSALLFLVLTALIGIATAGYLPRNAARSHLQTLVYAFVFLPLMLAIPFVEAIRDTSYLNGWFEMVSAFTTTGATLYHTPDRLGAALHLWRAEVGWLGGFFTLVTAVAILAPMNLGGFEVITGGSVGRNTTGTAQITRIADPSERLVRYALRLFPIYAALTLALWLGLLLVGETGFVALCHAMSVLSSSGISPVQGLTGGQAGIAGEFVVFPFLFFAISRRTLPGGVQADTATPLVRDPEFRIALMLMVLVAALLLLRHWVGAIERDAAEDPASLFRVLWGSVFTVLSFLSTTGFESADWTEATAWSGLDSPGLILLGLALVGGGVATTAGGVKLLRVYALFKHGQREMERLVHPHSIGGAGVMARRLRRQGAYIAWIFFMLFAISLALTLLALSLTGLAFEDALAFAVAALSTTGPLAQFVTEVPIHYAELHPGAKAILAAAMVLGRLETLAIIALLSPDLWRG